jgi:uncharacterized protein (TIGR02246 family)
MRILLVVALSGFAAVATAQVSPAPTPPPTQAAVAPDALHDELRKMRDDMLAAIKKNDFDAIVPHLHPNVVFTAMNGEVCRGPQAIRAYFDKMLKGPDAIVKSVSLDLTVDRLADFYGDTALAFGSSNDHYTLSNGMDFQIQTRWTAALVRQNGQWLMTAFHASTNVFDNPVLSAANRVAMFKWGGIGVVAGGLIGVLLAVVLARRRRG